MIHILSSPAASDLAEDPGLEQTSDLLPPPAPPVCRRCHSVFDRPPPRPRLQLRAVPKLSSAAAAAALGPRPPQLHAGSLLPLLTSTGDLLELHELTCVRRIFFFFFHCRERFSVVEHGLPNLSVLPVIAAKAPK